MKNLKGKLPPWYVDFWPPNQLWDEDQIEKIPGVGKKVVSSLHAIGVDTINDLKCLSIIDLKDIEMITNDANLTTNKLLKLQDNVAESEPGQCPYLPVEYRQDENPYKARFGENWKEEIGKVQLMSSYKCITDLINHLVLATDEVMRGTKYEGKGLFFHDALSLLTAKDSVAWMKEKGIYQRWIVPVLRCNDLVGENKNCYAKRPVGNSPELMCLDMSLNKDIRECLHCHVSITQNLEKDNPHRFSLATPK